jgi:hypothetical protein
MATIGNYYLNGPNLATATGIFTDAAFTTCAPDGWYSQGSVVRELDNCILLPRAQCPSCATLCGSTVIDGLAGYGLYSIPVELGTTTGAVKVTFDPKIYPQGIRAIYNSTVFNEFSSEVDGYHTTTQANGLTYMGNSSTAPTIPLTIVTTEWDYYDGAFTSNSSAISILVTEISSTSGQSPDECIAYIPKPLSSPLTLEVQVAQVINGQSTPSWNLTVACPKSLESKSCTDVDPAGGCSTAAPLDNSIYIGSVSGTNSVPAVNDWAFVDEYAETKKAAGDYVLENKAGDKYLITVSANGVITAVTACP